MADAPHKRPDPKDPDAAGEGWSEQGDAWYHTELLGEDKADDAACLAATKKRLGKKAVL